MHAVRQNNFDFLRLLFASLVIVTHSFDLSGLPKQEWLYRLTNGQTALSWISVRGFFVISGFLIFQSLQRSRSLSDYFKKRWLRLFPALAVVLSVTVLLAPFVYEGAQPFLSNHQVWSYLPNNLLLYRLQNSIDGIFGSNHISYVNASLWTIMYEFSMYVLLSGLFFIRHKAGAVKTVLWFSFAVFLLFTYRSDLARFRFLHFDLDSLADLGAYFLAGSLFAVYGLHRLRQNGLLMLLLFFFLFLALSLATDTFFYTRNIALPTFILSLGLYPIKGLKQAGKYGDFSYGIYLYAFPVQQTLLHFFKLRPVPLMLCAFLITLPLAIASWYLIEKRALKLKKKVLVPAVHTNENLAIKIESYPVEL